MASKPSTTSVTTTTTPSGTPKKYFIPLESDPALFTELIHTLGVSRRIAFHDLLTLTSPDIDADAAALLTGVPRPALALVVVIPAPQGYADRLAVEEEERGVMAWEAGEKKGEEEEDPMFYHQTIGNACGLYAALHAVSNGDAREFVEPQTPLADLITQCLPLSLPQRSAVLESSAALERAHASVASRGATPVPEDITVHPDFAYMTFTKTRRGGRLVQLEGCRKRPVDLDCVLGEREDMLSERALQAVKSFMEKEGKGVEVGYSAMAMCVGEEVGV